MSISGKTITAPINVQEPYTVLNVAPTNSIYDIGTICTIDKVNPESIYKPIKANTAYYDGYSTLPLSAWDAPQTSGWEVVENGKVNGSAIICRNMRLKAILATDYKRAPDWNLYKHNAVGPGLKFDVVQYVGYGQGSAFMGAADTALTFTAKITFPEIRPGAQPCAPSTSATVELVRYVGNNRLVMWTLPSASAEVPKSVHTKEEWAAQYGGKTKEVTFDVTADLPGAGRSKDYTFYLEINGCHQRCGKECSFTARAWKQWLRDPSDDNSALWQIVTPTVTNDYGDVLYSSIRRLEGRDTGTASDSGAYIRIRGLFCTGPAVGYVDIYIGGTRACRVSNGEARAVTWENGAQAGYTQPYTGQYTLNINGTPTTVTALNIDIRMDSKAWNSAVELRSSDRYGITI